jgi:hypothetical protein
MQLELPGSMEVENAFVGLQVVSKKNYGTLWHFVIFNGSFCFPTLIIK